MLQPIEVHRPFLRYVGVDLGGARGKTTAVAHLSRRDDGSVQVDDVATRARGEPWRDDTLAEHLAAVSPDTVIAIDAPLTAPACARCVLPACPGAEACVDPAVVWLREDGRALVEAMGVDAREHEAALAGRRRVVLRGTANRPRPRLQPYAHRCCDVVACFEREALPPTHLGAALGQIAARAGHLVRRLAGAGLALHERVLEVSPAATVAARLGPRLARGYKRDADPWVTRAQVLEGLGELTFARHSRLAREETLANDHCFDAILSAYTAFLWARDGWERPPAWQGALAADGWIWIPPA